MTHLSEKVENMELWLKRLHCRARGHRWSRDIKHHMFEYVEHSCRRCEEFETWPLPESERWPEEDRLVNVIRRTNNQ